MLKYHEYNILVGVFPNIFPPSPLISYHSSLIIHHSLLIAHHLHDSTSHYHHFVHDQPKEIIHLCPMFVPNNHPLWENQGWIRILLVKIGLLSSCHFMIHVMPDLAKIFKHKSFPTTIISPVIYIYINAYAQEEGKPSLCNFMNHCVYPHSHRLRMECL